LTNRWRASNIVFAAGLVAELADATDSKSVAQKRVGSSPTKAIRNDSTDPKLREILSEEGDWGWQFRRMTLHRVLPLV
jgi:hypothetical protein